VRLNATLLVQGLRPCFSAFIRDQGGIYLEDSKNHVEDSFLDPLGQLDFPRHVPSFDSSRKGLAEDRLRPKELRERKALTRVSQATAEVWRRLERIFNWENAPPGVD